MWKKIALLGLLAIVIFKKSNAQFENIKDSIIQIYGVVMSGDSLYLLPSVNIEVVGTNRGTVSNVQGVFSIVMYKGDTLKFSHVGYKTSFLTIPKTIQGNMISAVQMLANDIITNPVAIIRARPTREQFERDFVNYQNVNSVMIQRAMTNARSLDRALIESYNLLGTSKNSFENGQFMNNLRMSPISQGVNILNVLNPSEWNSIIKSWKSGKYQK